MTQAKGILPLGEYAVIKNPTTAGYLVSVRLREDMTRDEFTTWLQRASGLVDELVERVPETGERVSAVAVGLAPQLFRTDAGPRFDPPLQEPAGFASPPPLPGPQLDADVLFYAVSTSEARAARFISGLWGTRPDVTALALDRGYQRLDGTEPFGYADGLRNVPTSRRFHVVFVHREELPEEPEGAEGGSYMVFLRITQRPDAFGALPPEEQDQVIGRHRDGTRLDLPSGSDPRAEPEMPAGEPPAMGSHVRKVGPRGPHDDVAIFRRGLPFVETTADGQVEVGLNFVSFQGSLDQFDVVLNDWSLNPEFPQPGAGPDRLLDPASGLTEIRKGGIFFVPPHDDRFIAASMFDKPGQHRLPHSGRIAVRKRVVDPANPGARFERGGFEFQALDEQGQPVGEAFVTDSAGHALSPELPTGRTYALRELPTGRPNVQIAQDQQIVLNAARVVVRVENTIVAPGPYGSR